MKVGGHVSMSFGLDIRIVPTMWYFLFFF